MTMTLYFTRNPSENLDSFCQRVEDMYGFGSRDATILTEFAERLYSFFKLEGMLSRPEVIKLFRKMAEEPRKFVPSFPRDGVQT